MTGVNAASLLDRFFRANEKSDFDPATIVLALTELEQHVDVWEKAGTNVVAFREALPQWRREVFHFINPDTGRFGDYTASGQLTTGDIGVLSWMDERLSVSAPESTPESRAAIREMAQATRKMIVEDATIPDRLRLHITRLLHHVEEALENFEVTGDFVLEDAVERLLGALQLVEAASDEPSKWQKFRDQFMPSVAASLASEGAIQGIAAITAGVNQALS